MSMTDKIIPVAEPTVKKRFDTLHIVLFIILAIVVTSLITVWVIRTHIFPSEFKPVTLSQKEEIVLDRKLERLGLSGSGTSIPLEPESYSEEGAVREVIFSEHELNAMLAKNTDLADRLAIDLSNNLVSAKLLVHIDEDFPVMAGKTLKLKTGVELAYRDGKPVVALKGVSIMGVPIPNAWLGNLKNVDLVKEYGGGEGFWQSFADGVDQLIVEEGRLVLILKE